MEIPPVTIFFLLQIGGAEFTVHNLALQWHTQRHKVCRINNIADETTEPECKYYV